MALKTASRQWDQWVLVLLSAALEQYEIVMRENASVIGESLPVYNSWTCEHSRQRSAQTQTESSDPVFRCLLADVCALPAGF